MHTFTQWLQTASVNPEMSHGLIYLSMCVSTELFSLVMCPHYDFPLPHFYQNHFCAPKYKRGMCPSTVTNKT